MSWRIIWFAAMARWAPCYWIRGCLSRAAWRRFALAIPIGCLVFSVLGDLSYQRRLQRLAEAERKRRAAEIAAARQPPEYSCPVCGWQGNYTNLCPNCGDVCSLR